MKIEFLLMALLKRPKDLSRNFTLNIEEGTKLKTILSDLGYSNQEIRMFQLFVAKRGNEDSERISRSYELIDGDKIMVTIPVGGG